MYNLAVNFIKTTHRSKTKQDCINKWNRNINLKWCFLSCKKGRTSSNKSEIFIWDLALRKSNNIKNNIYKRVKKNCWPRNRLRLLLSGNICRRQEVNGWAKCYKTSSYKSKKNCKSARRRINRSLKDNNYTKLSWSKNMSLESMRKNAARFKGDIFSSRRRRKEFIAWLIAIELVKLICRWQKKWRGMKVRGMSNCQMRRWFSLSSKSQQLEFKNQMNTMNRWGEKRSSI